MQSVVRVCVCVINDVLCSLRCNLVSRRVALQGDANRMMQVVFQWILELCMSVPSAGHTLYGCLCQRAW